MERGMKMRRKIFLVLFSVLVCSAIAFGSVGCKEKVHENENKVTVALSESELSMVMGQSVSIYATVVNSEEEVLWTSTDSTVATVVNGKITALSDGETTIVGAVGEAFGQCRVTVASEESISLNRSYARVLKGQEIRLDADVKMGLIPSDGEVEWSVEDENIASVSRAGVVKGLKTGETIVIAKASGGKTAECAVKVEDEVKIVLSETNVTLHPNYQNTAEITVTGKKGDYALSASSLKWQSSDESLVTVKATNNGVKLTAKKSGKVVITATVQGSSEVAVCIVDSWYAISVPEDMEYMRTDINGVFKLVNDIDFEYAYWDGVTKWAGDGVPDSEYFGGVLDGQGYAIKNINILAGWNNGIIGQTNTTSVVRNLSVINLINQETSNKIGSIVSFNKGLIENCYVENTIKSDSQTNWNSHGGLVATNAQTGIIRNCIVKVTAERVFNNTGAIIGYNCGEVVNTYALCTDAVLPLCYQYSSDLGSFENCGVYSDEQELIENAELYKFSENIWTLTGRALPALYYYPEVDFNKSITYLALGGKYEISPANVKGIDIEWTVGENNGVLSIKKNEDNTLSVVAKKKGRVELSAFLKNGRFSKTEIVVTGTVLVPKEEVIELDYNNPSLENSRKLLFSDDKGNTVTSGFSFVSDNPSAVTVDASGVVTAAGAGVANISVEYEGDLYEDLINVRVTGWKQISTADQFQAIKDDHKSNYCLVSDIDFNNREFETITPYTSVDDNDLYFSGIFDGNGFTVKNIKVVGGDRGIWGRTAETAVIRNTNFENIVFYANNGQSEQNTFGVVSFNTGTIRDCSVRAVANAGHSVDYRTGGAVCGSNEFRGRVYNCIGYMDASAVTNDKLYVASIMGLCQGVAKDCIGVVLSPTSANISAIGFINSSSVSSCKQFASEEDAVADFAPFGSFDPNIWEIKDGKLPNLKPLI